MEINVKDIIEKSDVYYMPLTTVYDDLYGAYDGRIIAAAIKCVFDWYKSPSPNVEVQPGISCGFNDKDSEDLRIVIYALVDSVLPWAKKRMISNSRRNAANKRWRGGENER